MTFTSYLRSDWKYRSTTITLIHTIKLRLDVYRCNIYWTGFKGIILSVMVVGHHEVEWDYNHQRLVHRHCEYFHLWKIHQHQEMSICMCPYPLLHWRLLHFTLLHCSILHCFWCRFLKELIVWFYSFDINRDVVNR